MTGKVTEVSPLTAWQRCFAFQDGMTPLNMAAWGGRTAAAEVLLNRGASVDAVIKVGLGAAVLPDAASIPRCADAGRSLPGRQSGSSVCGALNTKWGRCEPRAASTLVPRPRFASAILPVARAGPQYITFTGHLASSGEQRDDVSRAMGKRAMAQLASDWENWHAVM